MDIILTIAVLRIKNQAKYRNETPPEIPLYTKKVERLPKMNYEMSKDLIQRHTFKELSLVLPHAA